MISSLCLQYNQETEISLKFRLYKVLSLTLLKTNIWNTTVQTSQDGGQSRRSLLFQEALY